MGYVLVGGICLAVGALVGIFTMAIVSVNRNTDEYPIQRKDIYTEEVKQDADRKCGSSKE